MKKNEKMVIDLIGEISLELNERCIRGNRKTGNDNPFISETKRTHCQTETRSC